MRRWFICPGKSTGRMRGVLPTTVSSPGSTLEPTKVESRLKSSNIMTIESSASPSSPKLSTLFQHFFEDFFPLFSTQNLTPRSRTRNVGASSVLLAGSTLPPFVCLLVDSAPNPSLNRYHSHHNPQLITFLCHSSFLFAPCLMFIFGQGFIFKSHFPPHSI